MLISASASVLSTYAVRCKTVAFDGSSLDRGSLGKPETGWSQILHRGKARLADREAHSGSVLASEAPE